MPFQYNALPVPYRYGSAAAGPVDVLYQYDALVLSGNPCDLVYQYSRDEIIDRDERQRGYWAWTTQELGNLMPGWSMIRHNVGGPSQQFINTWGMAFDQMKMDYARFRRNLFLLTADQSEPDLFWHAPSTDYGLEPKTRAKNLLQNSHFSLPSLARHSLPLHWTKRLAESTGIVELDDSVTLGGSNSVRLQAEDGEKCFLTQKVAGPIQKTTPITGSIWYMCPMSEDTEESDVYQASLELWCVYADGSADVVSEALVVGTGGIWRRASTSITLAKELFALKFTVRLVNTSGDTIALNVAAAQLERGSYPTSYEDPLATFVPFLREQAPLYDGPIDAFIDLGETETDFEVRDGDEITYTGQQWRRLQFISDERIFWEAVPPSRCTTTLYAEPAPANTQRTVLGWFATPENEFFTTSWRVGNNKLQQYNLRIPSETIGEFNLAEFNLDEEVNEQIAVMTTDEGTGFSRTLETVMVVKNLLWVVCKETEDGVTARYLKLVLPHSRWPLPIAQEQEIPMWLEVIGDVEIPISSGTVDYIGTIDENPEQMVMRIGSQYYRLDFQYDYYMFVANRRQAVLRTEYDGALVTV